MGICVGLLEGETDGLADIVTGELEGFALEVGEPDGLCEPMVG